MKSFSNGKFNLKPRISKNLQIEFAKNISCYAFNRKIEETDFKRSLIRIIFYQEIFDLFLYSGNYHSSKHNGFLF